MDHVEGGHVELHVRDGHTLPNMSELEARSRYVPDTRLVSSSSVRMEPVYLERCNLQCMPLKTSDLGIPFIYVR